MKRMKAKRPIPIIAVCTLLLIAGAGDVMTLSSFALGVAKLHVMPPWLSIFLMTFAPVMTLGCAGGMWMMRSWSVYLYACWVAVQDILLVTWLGVFSLPALTVQILVIMVSFYCICIRRSTLTEPCTPPHNGPATPLGTSGVSAGPPSVSATK